MGSIKKQLSILNYFHKQEHLTQDDILESYEAGQILTGCLKDFDNSVLKIIQETWEDCYGEDFKKEYPGFVKKFKQRLDGC